MATSLYIPFARDSEEYWRSQEMLLPESETIVDRNGTGFARRRATIWALQTIARIGSCTKEGERLSPSISAQIQRVCLLFPKFDDMEVELHYREHLNRLFIERMPRASYGMLCAYLLFVLAILPVRLANEEHPIQSGQNAVSYLFLKHAIVSLLLWASVAGLYYIVDSARCSSTLGKLQPDYIVCCLVVVYFCILIVHLAAFLGEGDNDHVVFLLLGLVVSMAQVAFTELVLALYFQVLPHVFLIVCCIVPILFIPVVIACPIQIPMVTKILTLSGGHLIFGFLILCILGQLDTERRVQFVLMAGVYRNVFNIAERHDKPRSPVAPRTLQEQLGERADLVGDQILDVSANARSPMATLLQVIAVEIRSIAQDLRCTPDLRKVDIREFEKKLARYSFTSGQVDEETQRYLFTAHHFHGASDDMASLSRNLNPRSVGRAKTVPTRKSQRAQSLSLQVSAWAASSDVVLTRYRPQVGRNYDLDCFSVDETTRGHSLQFVGMAILEDDIAHEQVLDLNLAPEFLQALELQYKILPYHSHIHAADMTNSLLVILQGTNLWRSLDDLEKSAIVISGLAHDVGHPGYNNNFLKQTKDTLTLEYSDRSVLEHMHCAILWKLLCDDNDTMPFSALLDPMDTKAFWTFREWTIDLILATDMKIHNDIVATFNLRLKHTGFLETKLSDADRLDTAKICMKAADLGHTAKEWDLHMQWSIRVGKEFFAQGDAEVMRGLGVSPGCLRPTLPKFMESQVSFLQALCVPLWNTVTTVAERLHESEPTRIMQLADTARSNIREWMNCVHQYPDNLPEALQIALDNEQFLCDSTL